MAGKGLTFWGITVRTIVVHTITYTIVGVLAFFLFDYSTQFAETELSLLMRPTTDPWVMAGPLFQPLRGLLFGVAFFLLREPLFTKRNGWLILWIALVVIGILSPFGPAPGSIEGMIYTVLPPSAHIGGGTVEVFLQSFLLSVLLFYWVRHPDNKWLNWGLGVIFVLLLALPALGLAVEYLQ